MATARAHEPALLDPKGPGITAIACTVGAILLLGAGGAAVYVAVRTVSEIGETGAGWTWAGAGLFLVAAFVACVGWSTLFSARWERRLTVRLAVTGVDATALVLSVSSAPPSPADDRQVRLLMRVDGPGFEPFECTCDVLAYRFGDAAQGTALSARVDPVTRVFTLERAPAPPGPGAGGG
ncbi:hypothetical protein OG242_32360 (plasmid) [Streptomyces sp. NBC_00727]|uniref:hypothetical protein n=1 Tax=Streptomyces sp. NBC_00727 TaxID=2903675 RepID=UPI002F90FF40